MKLKKMSKIIVTLVLVLLFSMAFWGCNGIDKNANAYGEIGGETGDETVTELMQILRNANNIILYNAGEIFDIDKNELLNNFSKMMEKARIMPALGVSLHNETIKSMKNGCWIEFLYSDEQTFAGMVFESLLVNIQEDFYGFNIIRNYKGEYTGRCYYIDLNGNKMHPSLFLK